MKEHILSTAAIEAGLILLAGCGTLMTHPEACQNVLPQDKDGNLTLDISNASRLRETPSIHIRVYIDGKIAVDRNFRYASSWLDRLTPVASVGRWKTLRFSLSEGTHTLRVESVKRAAQLEREFEIKDKHWGVIQYWYPTKYPPEPGVWKHFTFSLHDNPVGFL